LSAAKAAPAIAKLFPSEAQIIGLIKPLYEGVAEDQMRDPAALEAALVRTFEAFTRDRLIVRGLIVSPILGNNGTVEFLAWITSGDETSDRSLIAQAIEQLAKEPPSAGAV
jgi:predicted rRNA methylase YqxC with S4 and FtsJ domains